MGKLYIVSKLAEINYRMSVHEGNANHRLASEAIQILLLPEIDVPTQYQEEFRRLKRIIKKTLEELYAPGMTPSRIHHIQNRTATKYIKLLIAILVELETS